MAFQYPKCREEAAQVHFGHNSPVPDGDWSRWYRMMVPGREPYYQNRHAGHIGSYTHANLPDEGICGIYEWKVVKDEEEIVVYLGSSCNDGRAPLRNRILKYCRDGGHKSELIDDALKKGYELHVRYRQFPHVGASKEAENNLLERYNYAWNVRQNGVRAPRVGSLHN